MADFHLRATCRLCGHDDLERLLTLPDTPLANELPQWPDGHSGCTRWLRGSAPCSGAGPFVRSDDGDKCCDKCIMLWRDKPFRQDRFPLHLVGCQRCGHVQLPVVVDPKRLFPSDYPYQSGTSPVFRAHLAELAGTLATMIDEYGEVFDIACNDGTLVGLINAVGLHGRGIDPAAPGRHDMHLYREFFSEEWARREAEPGQYKAVTMLNAFAHIDDLDDVVRGVRVLLEPCGLFVIEVAYLPDMVRQGIWDTIYHEHLDFHHLSPLVRFFRKHGMTLVDAHRIDSQGGSVRIFVRNCSTEHRGGDDGHNLQSDRLQALLDDESRSQLWEGLRAMVPGTAYSGVRGVRDRIKAAAMRAGGKVAVYGAPAKLCTLLHATDTVDLVSFVADDNPLKQGRFVPGTAIPIKPVSELYKARPKVVLLGSWNFAANVRERHAELGCEWVVPFGGE